MTVESPDWLPPMLKDWMGLIRGEAHIGELAFAKVKKGVAHPVGRGEVKLAVARPKS